MPKVRVNKGGFEFHNACSYLQPKELKNRARGMFSGGESIKHGTEQRQVKSAEEEGKLPSQQGLTSSFSHSFNKLFLSTCFVADIVRGTRDNIISKTVSLLS